MGLLILYGLLYPTNEWLSTWGHRRCPFFMALWGRGLEHPSLPLAVTRRPRGQGQRLLLDGWSGPALATGHGVSQPSPSPRCPLGSPGGVGGCRGREEWSHPSTAASSSSSRRDWDGQGRGGTGTGLAAPRRLRWRPQLAGRRAPRSSCWQSTAAPPALRPPPTTPLPLPLLAGSGPMGAAASCLAGQ